MAVSTTSPATRTTCGSPDAWVGASMSRYILSRVIGMVPTVLVLLLAVVVLVRLLPGNAIDIILQEQVRAGDATRADMEKRLGLDKPVPLEFLDYSFGVLRGDLGQSVWS